MDEPQWVPSTNLIVAAGAVLGTMPERLIVQSVDEHDLVTLAGNTRPEAVAVNDRGAVSDRFRGRMSYTMIAVLNAADGTGRVRHAIRLAFSPSLRHSIETARLPQRLPTQSIAVQEHSIYMAKVREVLGHIPIH